MNDLNDRNSCPALEDIEKYISNPVFGQFRSALKTAHKCTEKIEFSSCSWEKGWNIKYKKAGKTLCTVYPRKNYFTVLVVVGKKEKESVEKILSECSPPLQNIYRQTAEGNGQKWLMVDVEDQDALYEDLLRLIQIRRNC